MTRLAQTIRLLSALLSILFLTSVCPAQDRKDSQQSSKKNSDLPHVLIIGDSISIGYTKPTIELLKGVADVERVKANCGDTQRGLKNLKRWLGKTDWDVIHFNWGLHDLCYRHPDSKTQGHRDKVNGTISVPLDEYEKNLEALVQQLEKTGATLIWATTTPVPEGEAGRVVGDDLKYNEVATKIMKQHGIKIDDLHKLALSFDASLWAGPGNVHFKPAGSAKLAKQVASEIKAALPENKTAGN
ncbi:SGNH/GDSL hydrolase family protein [Gimesia panareensis]|uniref:SGNH/GDSL hydrolase family protein n=1 Tax=Gimesia panareensis TaxID=2527978 RepID=UPI0011880391|nr:SGNH/GDSL hydrolase family protein [Gimesia panareensis]QDU47912.1 GDSL-like Lipase/Acylhydrolase [Gimesia panareensis]